MQNGFCGAFNGRMRDELLNETLFFGLDHARTAIGPGSPTTTSRGRTPRSATRHRRPTPANYTAIGDRLRETQALRRSPIAPSAQPLRRI